MLGDLERAGQLAVLSPSQRVELLYCATAFGSFHASEADSSQAGGRQAASALAPKSQNESYSLVLQRLVDEELFGAEASHLSPPDTVRLLFVLALQGPPRYTVQHFGLLVMRLRETSWSRLSGNQLAVLAACQHVLGVEGIEMAHEVLPGECVRQGSQALWERLVTTSAAADVQRALPPLEESLRDLGQRFTSSIPQDDDGLVLLRGHQPQYPDSGALSQFVLLRGSAPSSSSSSSGGSDAAAGSPSSKGRPVVLMVCSSADCFVNAFGGWVPSAAALLLGHVVANSCMHGIEVAPIAAPHWLSLPRDERQRYLEALLAECN